MRTLLCVEDERDILQNNRRFFENHGYNVLTAENLAQARNCLAKQTPDAILLDIMLPDGNGLDLLQELRGAGSKLPIIMLTAWGEPKDVSRGYRLGATAYLSKPFDYEAVEAAIEGIFGAREETPEVVRRGALTLNLNSMVAYVNGDDILLTQKEFALLLFFMRNEDKALSADYLYEKVWGVAANNVTRAVKVQVSNLRRKIEDSGYVLTAIRGDGYRFGKEF